ncbi:hypothetical protein KP509_38G026400 [Ceratopteris richardii]|nr:hypothetical protein KP509_38G026400 [Ceratopteris richardii]
MRLDDYISFYLIDDPSSDFLFQWHLRLGMKRSEEAAFNLGNNFEALEYEACRAFKEFVPNFLPIGPLLSVDILQCKPHMEAPAGISLMVEDATCNEWLSKHEKASVVYVSFGSMVNMPEEEVANIILGLEMIGAPFLWVARPDQSSAALSRFRESPSHQVLVVSWAPQIAVLTHPSVGLFISHCGWNSFLESMAGGVPILAKPGAFAEQRMNAHYIEEVWKVGHRLPDPVSACAVKSLVSSLLGSSTEAADMKRRMLKIKESARDALTPEGSSITNFDIFVNDMYRRAGMTYS